MIACEPAHFFGQERENKEGKKREREEGGGGGGRGRENEPARKPLYSEFLHREKQRSDLIG